MGIDDNIGACCCLKCTKRQIRSKSPESSKKKKKNDPKMTEKREIIWLSPSYSFKVNSSTHWRRKWQPTPVFLTGESHGQRSLVGYSPWGCRVRYDWVTNTSTHSWQKVKQFMSHIFLSPTKRIRKIYSIYKFKNWIKPL